MAKKIGKKQRKAKRIPEPASYFIGSEGTKTEVLYFKWIADRLEEQYSGFQCRIEVPSFHIKGIGSSNLRLLDDIEEYLKNDPMLPKMSGRCSIKMMSRSPTLTTPFLLQPIKDGIQLGPTTHLNFGISCILNFCNPE